MKKRIVLILFFCLLSIFKNGFSESIPDNETKPLWEFGLFNGAARLPHYRGSNEYNLYALPLPYLIYRGKIIESDREGLKGLFFRTERTELALSVFGNPPVEEDNKARKGMEQLAPLIEIGPALKWFFRPEQPDRILYLRTALRSAISADSSLEFDYQGLHGNVVLIYRNLCPFGKSNWSYGLNGGIDFGDRCFNRYFYDVPEGNSRPDRPVYRSHGGYAGFALSANLVRELNKKISLGCYFRWENISGSIFEDSPLVKQKDNFVVGCALIWKIAKSKQHIARHRDRFSL